MKSENEKNLSGQSKSATKKAYDSPKLSSFGTVTQLTQAFVNMMKDDGGMGMNSMIS